MTERDIILLTVGPKPDVEVSVRSLSKDDEGGFKISARPLLCQCERDDVNICLRRILEALNIKPTDVDSIKKREVELICDDFEASNKGVDEYFKEVLKRVFGMYWYDLDQNQRNEIEGLLMKDYFPTKTIFISNKQMGDMIRQVLTRDYEDRGYEEA